MDGGDGGGDDEVEESESLRISSTVRWGTKLRLLSSSLESCEPRKESRSSSMGGISNKVILVSYKAPSCNNERFQLRLSLPIPYGGSEIRQILSACT